MKRWLGAILLAMPVLAQGAEVTLAWDANPADQLVTEYVLYMDDAEVARTGESAATVDVDAGAHVFEVTAVNRWGESGRSEPAGTPPLASPPRTLSVTVAVTVTVVP